MNKVNNHNIEREIKLNKLIDRLAQGGFTVHMNPFDPNTKHAIDRQTLKELIAGTLNEVNRHTLSAWINYLVALGILEHNPQSQISPHGHKMPTDDTRYFINADKLVRHTLSTFNKAPHILDPEQSLRINSSDKKTLDT